MRPFGWRVVATLTLWISAGFLAQGLLGPAAERAAQGTGVREALRRFTGDAHPPSWAGAALYLSAMAFAFVGVALALWASRAAVRAR